MVYWTRIDKGDGSRQLVTEEEVRQKIDSYYQMVDLAIESARKSGLPLETNFALYEPPKEA